MQTRFKGRVWTFGDDISTDHIIAGKYLGTTDSKVFADHAFEAVDPSWAKKVQTGDIIVAGGHFGCGSRPGQPPAAPLKPRTSVVPALALRPLCCLAASNP